jgi:hypothetical protein
MALSSAKRGWVAVGVFLLLLAASAGVYLELSKRAARRTARDAGSPIFAPSAQKPADAISLLAALPGNAPAIAFIDVGALRRLQDSPLPALLGLSGTKSREDPEYRQFVRETGFDYARDLERVAAAFWLDDPGETQQRPPRDYRIFIAADGRFDQAKIRAYALKSGKVHASGNQSIYEIRGDPAVSFAFLTPSRIAIVSGPHATEVIAGSHAKGSDPSFQARLDRVAVAPLFAVARTDGLPKTFFADLSSSREIENLARSVRSLTLAAQPQGKLLRLVIDGESSSGQNALAITTLLEIARMGASITLADPKTSSHLTSQQDTFLNMLVREAVVSRQDRWVRLSLDITPQMLGSDEMTSAAPERSKISPSGSPKP